MSQRLSLSPQAQWSTLTLSFLYFLHRYKMTGQEGLQTAGVQLVHLGVQIDQKSRGQNTPKTFRTEMSRMSQQISADQ